MTRGEALRYFTRFEAIADVDRDERRRVGPNRNEAFRIALSLIDFASGHPEGAASLALRAESDRAVRSVWAKLRDRLA